MGIKFSNISDPTKLSQEQINLLLACTSFKESEIRSWHNGFMASLFYNFVFFIYLFFVFFFKERLSKRKTKQKEIC